VQALGPTDEVVAARGMSDALAAENHGGNGGTAALYFPQGYADRVARAAAGSSLVDGVEPVIIEEIAVQDVSTSQNEPRVMLFASDPARMKGFGEIRSDGKTVSLADLRPRQVFLNAHAADELDARAGDTIKVFAGEALRTYRVRAIVRYDAIKDVGGRQSTTIALLDATGSGVVVSAIQGRDYARLYVKDVVDGQAGSMELTPEERQAVERALA